MSDQADNVLSVQNVDLGYGSLKVVFDASLTVKSGELVGLIGGNGSGKSTILRAVSGMIKPWKGTIHFDGQEVSGRKPHEMARLGLAHVPMGRQLFGNMTVHDNLLHVTAVTKIWRKFLRSFLISKSTLAKKQCNFRGGSSRWWRLLGG